MLLQMSSAISAAKAATIKGSFKGNSTAPSDEAAGNCGTQDDQGAARAGMSSIASRISTANLSIRAFRRGSRTEENNDTCDQPNSPDIVPQRTDKWSQPEESTSELLHSSIAPNSGERENVMSTFGIGASGEQSVRNETTINSPRQAPIATGNLDQANGPVGSTPTTSAVPTYSGASSSVSAGVRKGKRVFAGGVWSANSGLGQAASVTTGAHHREASTDASTSSIKASVREASPQPSSAPEGGKRRFAGGDIWGGLESGSSASGQADNPFGAASGCTSGVATDCSDHPARGAALAGETSRSQTQKTDEVQSVPSWAMAGNDSDTVPDWARGADAGSTAYAGYGSGGTTGMVLAPSSR